MECQELRQELGEWRRGRLASREARALEHHLSICPECQGWEREDGALSRLLTEGLVRHRAPAYLKQEILKTPAARARYSWWSVPATALATAMLMVLLFLPRLPRSIEPLQPFIRAVYSQHTRSLLWGEPQPEPVDTVLPRLMAETGIGLSSVFMGDDNLRLFGAEPVVLQGRWGLTLHYKDPEDHMVSYVVLPGQGLSVPDRSRVEIDRFHPMLARTDGFSVLVWKQEGLACFLISDLVSENDVARFREYFLKIRSTTEPFLIS